MISCPLCLGLPVLQDEDASEVLECECGALQLCGDTWSFGPRRDSHVWVSLRSDGTCWSHLEEEMDEVLVDPGSVEQFVHQYIRSIVAESVMDS